MNVEETRAPEGDAEVEAPADEGRAQPALFPTRGARAAFAVLVALVLAGHVAFALSEPAPRLWGDEPEYAAIARGLAERGGTGLLPGRLPFEHRPLLGVQLVSSLRTLLGEPSPYRTASGLWITLMPVLLLLVYAQGRRLGLTWPAAWSSAAALASSPWFGFHAHSMWPEVLHATLFAAALLGLVAHARTGRLAPLVPSALATAYALFAKGVLGPFVPVFGALLVLLAWRRTAERGLGTGRRALHALAPAALWVGTTLAVLAPQLARNHADGHGVRIAANRWWNLEVGLTADPPARTVGEVNAEYMAAATEPAAREELARERVRAFVRASGPGAVLARQLEKLGALVTKRLSAFEMSLLRTERWGAEPPRWIAALRLPGRAHWYALLALGALGAGLVVRDVLRGTAPAGPWALVLAFAAGFVVALGFVPVKVRFALPLVPVLALLVGAVVEAALRRRAGRRSA